MALTMTCIAVIAAVPAALIEDDGLSFALGLNALIWSAMAVGVNMAVV